MSRGKRFMLHTHHKPWYLSLCTVAVVIYSTASYAQQQSFQQIAVNGQDINDTYKSHPTWMYREQYDTYQSSKRLLIQYNDDNPDNCTNVCVVNNNGTIKTTSSERVNSLLLSRAIDVEVLDENDESIFMGLFRRIFTSLFRRPIERHNTDYVVPTRQIIPLLSIHSNKFNSFSQLIRNETAHSYELSTRPDIIQKMYALSAENMESVSTLFDSIILDMEQQETIDLPMLGCNLRQIVSLFKDITIPNIELMLMILFTKTNNPDTTNMYNEYIETKTTMWNTTVETTSTQSNKLNYSCSDVTTRSRRFDITDISAQYGDFSIIGHVVILVALLVFLPLSVVVGPIIGVLGIIIEIFRVFTSDKTNQEKFWEFVIFVYVFLPAAFGLVFVDIILIVDQIRGIIHDIVRIFNPTNTKPPTVSPTWTLQAQSNSTYDDKLSNVLYHVQNVLKSPMDAIIAMMDMDDRNKDSSGLNNDKYVKMDCEMAALICKSDALLDALPF